MLSPHKRVVTTLIVVAAITVAGLSLALARKPRWHTNVSKTGTKSVSTQSPQTSRAYVRPGALWPQLRWNLKALGDRLQRPGKEQVIMTGNLTRAGVSAPVPVALNIEA